MYRISACMDSWDLKTGSYSQIPHACDSLKGCYVGPTINNLAVFDKKQPLSILLVGNRSLARRGKRPHKITHDSCPWVCMRTFFIDVCNIISHVSRRCAPFPRFFNPRLRRIIFFLFDKTCQFSHVRDFHKREILHLIGFMIWGRSCVSF